MISAYASEQSLNLKFAERMLILMGLVNAGHMPT
jgi:hypothetical protein